MSDSNVDPLLISRYCDYISDSGCKSKTPFRSFSQIQSDISSFNFLKKKGLMGDCMKKDKGQQTDAKGIRRVVVSKSPNGKRQDVNAVRKVVIRKKDKGRFYVVMGGGTTEKVVDRMYGVKSVKALNMKADKLISKDQSYNAALYSHK